jgi:hypothetical protein
MKRAFSLFLAVLFVLVIVTGCGGSSSVTGKYYTKSIDGVLIEDYFKSELEGLEGFSIDDYLSLVGITAVEEFITVELKADGTAVVGVAGEDASTGTWVQNGDKITITIDGEAVDFAVKGNEISFSEDDQVIVLVKK